MYFLSCFIYIYIVTLILTLGIKPKRLLFGSPQKMFAGAALITPSRPPFLLATGVVPVRGSFQNRRPGHYKSGAGRRSQAAKAGGGGSFSKQGCEPSQCCHP